MKPIELTEEHKSKLIEMCKVLFPKYKDVRLGDERAKTHKYQDPWSYDFVIFLGDLGFCAFQAHWFEFCLTNLSSKIYNQLYDFSSSKGYMTADTGEEHAAEWLGYFFNRAMFYKNNITREEFHPVNYLYEEFKKIK